MVLSMVNLADLSESDQECAHRGDNDDADKNERHVLRPELNINVNVEQVHRKLEAPSDWVDLAHSPQCNARRRHRELVDAVHTQPVADDVENFPSPRVCFLPPRS